MSEYIIANNDEGDFYAYYKQRFWRCMSWQNFWNESLLTAQAYAKARDTAPDLTPGQFFETVEHYTILKDGDISNEYIQALMAVAPDEKKTAKEKTTCATVPNADAAATTAESAVPNAAAETLTTSESAADASASAPAVSPLKNLLGPAANVESSPAARPAPSMTVSTPAFDYTQFDEQTAQTLQNFAFRALQVARTYYRDLMEIVVGAHKLLCGTVVHDVDNGKFAPKEDTFRAWCSSVHISKSKAYQLLQIQSFMDTCTPEEQSTLALLPFTAMRELVTGDTPEQVITMAKEGKVGTSKEVLELKAQLKAKERELAETRARLESSCIQEQKSWDAMNTANAQLEAANADIKGLTEQNAQLKERANAAEAREEEAWKMQSKAEARAQNAENQLSGSRQVAEAAKLRADKLQEENAALKKQPIAAVVDEEEVDRRAGEKAYEIAAGMTADYKAQQEQDARDAYDSIILAGRSITSIVQSAKMQFRKLPDDQRETAINQFVHTLASAQGEVSACL